MDLATWLWERVERRDGPAILAHALNTAPVRDALLRHAAITGRWNTLAGAAAEAANAAPVAGWSRHGPDAVAAVCHWIDADRALRRIPSADRAAPFAAAALAAWHAPEQVAAHLAATPPLTAAESTHFEAAIRADADAAPLMDLVEELIARMTRDPELAAHALNHPQVRAALLMRAARTGEWDELAEITADAAEAASVGGLDPTGAESAFAMASSQGTRDSTEHTDNLESSAWADVLDLEQLTSSETTAAITHLLDGEPMYQSSRTAQRSSLNEPPRQPQP